MKCKSCNIDYIWINMDEDRSILEVPDQLSEFSLNFRFLHLRKLGVKISKKK